MRSLVILLLSIFLTGCSDNYLRSQNTALQQQVEDLQKRMDAHQVSMDYWQERADLGAACSGFIPLCPSAITESARDANKHGFVGGMGWHFWIFFLLKLAGLGALAGGGWAGYRIVAARRLLPAKEELENAHRVVRDAQREREEAQKAAADSLAQVSRARGEAAAVLAEANERRGEVAALQKDIDEHRAEVKRLTADIERLKATRDLLI